MNMTSASQKIAIYPGSFDPMTFGHIDIIQRLAPHFDELIVVVAQSSSKSELFTVQERVQMASSTLANFKNVKVQSYAGLTVDFARKVGAKIIVRGLRAVVDFEYETSMANMNRKLAPEIETMLIFASPEYYFISSRGVKEVARNGGPLEGMVPDSITQALYSKLAVKKGSPI